MHPETPLFDGTPQSLINFPAPLYIPQVIIKGIIARIVLDDNTFYPVFGTIPLFDKVDPKFAKLYTVTIILHS